jgi:hypothetical protein
MVCGAPTDFTDDLKKITVPVLVMHGDDNADPLASIGNRRRAGVTSARRAPLPRTTSR